MSPETRNPRSPLAAAALSVAAVFLLVAPASALPVDVFFDGEIAGGTNYGISEASAIDARDNYGVQIIDNATLDVIDGRLSAVPTFQTATPNPPVSSENRSTWDWAVTADTDLVGASYLLFTHTDPYDENGVRIDYADVNVGITIDADLGWAIVKASFDSVDYYYPALLLDRAASNPLDGVLADGDIADPFDVLLVVKEPITFLDASGGPGSYWWPDIEIGYANLVPEPSTALLFGLGLVGLGLRGRRR
jgi:hypothetical protein